jgi:hypothetical protein
LHHNFWILNNEERGREAREEGQEQDTLPNGGTYCALLTHAIFVRKLVL